MDNTYFSHELRKGITQDFLPAVEKVFSDLYEDTPSNRERNASKSVKQYREIQQNPLFVELLSSEPKQLDGENSKCEEVFAEYLKKMANYCNPSYFARLLKFVCLFRDCVNIMYKSKVNEVKDYTEIMTAEDVPDISNEFITEFLEPEQTFNINKEEAIDLTQNFCHWLYENNYTCSKLSLINS